MASLAQKVGILALGGVLGSGATMGVSEFSKSRNGGSKPEVEEKGNYVEKNGYVEVDANTFVITPDTWQGSATGFGKNLAQFRKEHSGDFILIPKNTEYPFSDGVLVARKDQVSDDGKTNTIIAPDKK